MQSPWRRMSSSTGRARISQPGRPPGGPQQGRTHTLSLVRRNCVHSMPAPDDRPLGRPCSTDGGEGRQHGQPIMTLARQIERSVDAEGDALGLGQKVPRQRADADHAAIARQLRDPPVGSIHDQPARAVGCPHHPGGREPVGLAPAAERRPRHADGRTQVVRPAPLPPEERQATGRPEPRTRLQATTSPGPLTASASDSTSQIPPGSPNCRR